MELKRLPDPIIRRGCRRCGGDLTWQFFDGEWRCAQCGWREYEAIRREKMRLVVTNSGINIIPETAQDEAFLVHVLGLVEVGTWQ